MLEDLTRISALSASDITAEKLKIFKHISAFADFARDEANGQVAFDIVYGMCKNAEIRQMFGGYISLTMKNPELVKKHENLDRIFELAKFKGCSALACLTPIGDIGDYPIQERIDEIFDLIFTSTTNQYAACLLTMLPSIARRMPDLFVPEAKRFFDLLRGQSTASLGYAILVEIGAHNPKAINQPNVLDELERALASNPHYAFYAYQVLGKAGRADEASCTKYLAWLQQRFPTESASTQSNVLMAMRDCATEYRLLLEPHLSFFQDIVKSTAYSSTCIEVAQQTLDFFYERTLEKVDSKVEAMGEIWTKLGLQADDPLVKAVTETVNVKDFDVMISYNWNHKDKVLRIRDALIQYGVSIWMDVEQMSGNIYGKMAEAVLGCKVIIPCMTGAYEASQNCKRELGYAADKRRKIVPIRLEMIDFTWSGLITAGAIYTVMTDKEFDDPALFDAAIVSVVNELQNALGRPLRKGTQADVVKLKAAGDPEISLPPVTPTVAATPALPMATAPKPAAPPASVPKPAVAAVAPAMTGSAAAISPSEFAKLQQSHEELQKAHDELKKSHVAIEETVAKLLARVAALEQSTPPTATASALAAAPATPPTGGSVSARTAAFGGSAVPARPFRR